MGPAELLAAFRSRGAFVVLVKIGWSADGKDRLQPICDESFTRKLSLDDAGGSCVGSRAATSNSRIIKSPKRQTGAFYGTDLDLHIGRRGITTLVLSGISPPPSSWTKQRALAFERGYHQSLPGRRDDFDGRRGASGRYYCAYFRRLGLSSALTAVVLGSLM